MFNATDFNSAKEGCGSRWECGVSVMKISEIVLSSLFGLAPNKDLMSLFLSDI